MMKSSDEIKKAMLHCSPVSCRSDGCPYRDDTPKYEGDMPACRMKLWHDMVCLIQQLEAERDAAVADIKQMVLDPYEPCFCDYCKLTEEECARSNCKGRSAFVWRGVQKEE